MDKNNIFKSLILHLLFKNPVVIFFIIIFIFLFAIFSIGMGFIGGENESPPEDGFGNVNCTPGQVNASIYYSAFDKAGVFKGMGADFEVVGIKNNVDPVLLAAIAFHETGFGSSNLVKNKNNPGGLYDSSRGEFFSFPTLQDGLDMMARNLFKNYISQNLLTITQIGAKYAPIGVANDPNNLNANWVPTVTRIANDLGGLTMNCEVVNAGSGEYLRPLGNAPITSNFGYRIDPITGASSEFHKGMDFGAPLGTPIAAAKGGKVVVSIKSGWGGGYGHHVVINTGEKLNLYAHMSGVNVNVGDQVNQGQTIGSVGSTGSSTGPHLHFEVQLSLYGERIDPKPFFGQE
ncbi:peptidoglycan DD-metalloendopeptidase family protein [Cytobacillus oceanisediminis]|uniref:peptidoglycan DD-metalloendopeptidase family protein n=1 Tax=Cytobacillus oceanisediminis TaxID=665099 RepID=UPI001C248643|nr:peptidoglycan DD-metalloendopeptidase family protein [Cytobacillus oceanisediminis]MBU8732519.1 peptidoglycan DD-metalloendopeptidase family protein [Cytobacillus oceanisediminis]